MAEHEVTPSENDLPVVCPRCKNRRVIPVLGSGGDYENWACPECRPKDYEQDVFYHYNSSSYDSDDAD